MFFPTTYTVAGEVKFEPDPFPVLWVSHMRLHDYSLQTTQRNFWHYSLQPTPLALFPPNHTHCDFRHYSLQTTPTVTFGEEEQAALTERIQNAGTEVVNAKAGAVSEPCMHVGCCTTTSEMTGNSHTGFCNTVHGLCWGKIHFKGIHLLICLRLNLLWCVSVVGGNDRPEGGGRVHLCQVQCH